MMLPKVLKERKFFQGVGRRNEDLPLIDGFRCVRTPVSVTRSACELTEGQRRGASPAHPEL